MENSKDVREFLMSRRSRITPVQAGLSDYGGTRRVSGLKREEVAMLTGVSTEYYARLERGNLRGASESVLESLAAALQLEEAERAHLFDLAKAAAGPPKTAGTRQTRTEIRPSVLRILDGMTGTPAFVRNYRMDLLAANNVGFALFMGLFNSDALPVNLARFMFLDPRARDFFVEWATLADDVAAALRTEVGRNPRDRALNNLIRDLATGSTEFSPAGPDITSGSTEQRPKHSTTRWSATSSSPPTRWNSQEKAWSFSPIPPNRAAAPRNNSTS